MTNSEMLREAIKKKGLKLSFVAETLGITGWGLTLKIENKNEFKTSEVKKICNLLEIEDWGTIETIFFAGKVDE